MVLTRKEADELSLKRYEKVLREVEEEIDSALKRHDTTELSEYSPVMVYFDEFIPEVVRNHLEEAYTNAGWTILMRLEEDKAGETHWEIEIY